VLRLLVAWGVWMVTMLLVALLWQKSLLSQDRATAIGLLDGLLFSVVFWGPDFDPVGPTLVAIVVISLAVAFTFRLIALGLLWKG
jgi:hypothetical protein